MIRKTDLHKAAGLINAVILLFACGHPESPRNEVQKIFTLLNEEQTGVHFRNDVVDGEKFNIFTYRNYYNGGGVGIGDINNDGLPDIYLVANQNKNKLYLNKGNFLFEDITEKAGVGGTMAWSTGVTIADVNDDGFLDIYVCNSGDVDPSKRENELFINNGDLTFTERAKEYNLDNNALTIHASFFDYDSDGDLDCYILNNCFSDPSRIELYRKVREEEADPLGDKLMRNDGGIFHDVTAEAGIYSSVIGFGNGVVVSDFNNDTLPDIYVANDFWERDYLYINRGNGRFSEELAGRMNYCSTSSMGGDAADINNDGYTDLFTTDMLPADNHRLQTTIAFDPYHPEDLMYRENFYYQITQNCLHLNNGSAEFSEIAQLAGVDASDWSWGALIFDFENDGRKDLFISNGILRDIMYNDFIEFITDRQKRMEVIASEGRDDYRDFVKRMPSSPLKNYACQDTGNLFFVNRSELLGLGDPSYSNGAAYGDLDNDGDQDLVVNNENSPAFIYRNDAGSVTGNHFLKVVFNGNKGNRNGIGSKVTLKLGGEVRMLENYNSRGFESCTTPDLVFGLGRHESVDSLMVIWPDGKAQTLTSLKSDQEITLEYSNAVHVNPVKKIRPETLYEEAGNLISGDTRHKENQYDDFAQEILLVAMLSTEGPRLITGDVNGDGLKDFLLPGAAGDPDKLFIGQHDGRFALKPNSSFVKDRNFESTCGLFFDNDGDGDQDLLLGSGGNDVRVEQLNYIVRYYKNDGSGSFSGDPYGVPPVLGNFSVIEAADYDNCGRNEIFIGARAIPGNYGLPPQSYLLKYVDGRWADIAPASLGNTGMVTDAAWADADSDGDIDLIVTGDWMPVKIFRNRAGVLQDPDIIPHSEGWWRRIEPSDIDKDGKIDFILGNWGLNTKFKASVSRPLSMFANDFDNNGKSEFIINWYPPLDTVPWPFAQRQELVAELPMMRHTVSTFEKYASKTYYSLFPPDIRQKSIAYRAETLQTSVLWNDSNGFTLQPLPAEAQVSPVFGIVADDLDGDGLTDIWLGGNFYSLKPQAGRHDASRGVFLKGRGRRTFEYLAPELSGIYVTGEVRDAAVINSAEGKLLLAARNNNTLLVFRNIGH